MMNWIDPYDKLPKVGDTILVIRNTTKYNDTDLYVGEACYDNQGILEFRSHGDSSRFSFFPYSYSSFYPKLDYAFEDASYIHRWTHFDTEQLNVTFDTTTGWDKAKNKVLELYPHIPQVAKDNVMDMVRRKSVMASFYSVKEYGMPRDADLMYAVYDGKEILLRRLGEIGSDITHWYVLPMINKGE